MASKNTLRVRDISKGYRRERPVTVNEGPNRAARRANVPVPGTDIIIKFRGRGLARPFLVRRAVRRLARRAA